MMPRMIRGLRTIGELPELETELMIREVENGWVIDVDVPGDPVPGGDVDMLMPRFAKFVSRTGVELLRQVEGLLESFNVRRPHASNRIVGNLHMHVIDKRVAVVQKLDGGYVITTLRPVKVKRIPLKCVDPNLQGPEEVTETESVEKIVVSNKNVLGMIGRFFDVVKEGE